MAYRIDSYLPLLAANLTPSVADGQNQVRRWIADLDSEDFETRQIAARDWGSEDRMEPVTPSGGAIAVLRAISQGGFSYLPTKALASAAGWMLVDDEPGVGYLRYDMFLTTDKAVRRPLTVQTAESATPRWAFVPLFYFEEYDDSREQLDWAFRSVREQLIGFLGAASCCGEYNYPHRPAWPYLFAGWTLADATLVLVEDELDIQFGMDVTLWILPAGTPATAPVRVE